jgi:hypothetical protein
MRSQPIGPRPVMWAGTCDVASRVPRSPTDYQSCAGSGSLSPEPPRMPALSNGGERTSLMRCKSCGRFFRPDPRVGGRQKACARAQCKQAIKKRQVTAWRARSHEHLLAYEQDRRETHRDELRAYHRVYYAQNRDTIRGRQIPYGRQYRRDNRLELATKMRTRYRRDPRVYQARVRAWKKK